MKVFALLYAGALLASIAEGFFLVLPLYVEQAGGNELTVGWILWGSAAGSILLVGSMTRLLDVMKPVAIAALGCAAYAGGAAIFAFADRIAWYSIVAGFLQGAGVGLCVASYPIVITGLIDDSKRSVHFSVLAAFGIAGMGISPVLAGLLASHGVGYREIFLGSALAGARGSLCEPRCRLSRDLFRLGTFVHCLRRVVRRREQADAARTRTASHAWLA